VRRPGEPAALLEVLDVRAYCKEELNVSNSEIEDLVGDGLARVVVSLERSDKSYGNGVSVFCSAALTCNQDAETVAQAQDWALGLVSGFLPDAVETALGMFPPGEPSSFAEEAPRRETPSPKTAPSKKKRRRRSRG